MSDDDNKSEGLQEDGDRGSKRPFEIALLEHQSLGVFHGAAEQRLNNVLETAVQPRAAHCAQRH